MGVWIGIGWHNLGIRQEGLARNLPPPTLHTTVSAYAGSGQGVLGRRHSVRIRPRFVAQLAHLPHVAVAPRLAVANHIATVADFGR